MTSLHTYRPILRHMGRYVLALGLVAAANVLCWSLPEVLSPRPFLAFWPMVILAAEFGGMGPGLFATTASALCVGIIFHPPYGQLSLHDWVGMSALAIFLAGGLAISVFIGMKRKMQAHERLQASAMQAANDAIALTDGNGVILWVNSAFCAITGYTPKEIVGKTHRLLNSGEPNEASHRNLWSSIRRGKVWHGELASQRKDGTPYVEEQTVTPLTDADGQIIHHVIIMHDITERKQADEILRESERKNKFLADVIRLGSQPVGVGYPDGRLGMVNSAFEQLTGYSLEELQSINWATDLTPPEWFPIEQAKLEELHHTGKTVCYKKEYIRKNGTRVPIELLVHLVNAPDGKPEYYYSYVTDITERKRSEDALRTSERFLKEVLNSLSSHIAVLDEEGRILTVNNAWRDFACKNASSLEGLVEGANYLEVCEGACGEGADLAAAFAEGIRSLVLGERDGFTMEYPCHSPWENRWFIGRVTRFHGEMPLRIVVSHQNITERKQAEEEIRQQSEQLRALAARLAEVEEVERQHLARELHDRVGQNLSALGVNLTLRQAKLPEGAREKGLLARLADSGALLEQTIALVRNLMADLRPPGLDEYGFLEALRWYSDSFSRRTGIQVIITGEELAQRLPPLKEISLFRIAQEALTNIAKHARATRVTLSQTVDNVLVRLTIADNGVGFDLTPGQLKGSGGWGLMTMKERALGVGGKCRIESQPSCGTRVLVEVPR